MFTILLPLPPNIRDANFNKRYIQKKIIQNFSFFTQALYFVQFLFPSFSCCSPQVSFFYWLVQVTLDDFIPHQLGDLTSGECFDVKCLLQKFICETDGDISNVEEGVFAGHDVL